MNLDAPIPISLFRSARDREPTRADLPLEQLFGQLTRFRDRSDVAESIRRALLRLERPSQLHGWLAERVAEMGVERVRESIPRWEKARLAAWNPATYRPGTTRASANVVTISALAFDLDRGESLRDIWALWPEHPRVLYTTWSHTVEHPKARLVVPLAEPVPPEGWGRVWDWANQYMKRRGVIPDSKCSDPTRLYFLPAVSSGLQVHHSRVETAGTLLSIDWRSIPDLRRIRRSMSRGIRIGDAKLDYSDPLNRMRAAQQLRASVGGHGENERAYAIICPSCSRPSAYFYLLPRAPSGWAVCHHKASCGWTGSLANLVGAPCPA